MNPLMRYLRAFASAVKLTLRGQKPVPSAQLLLSEWMKRSAELVDAALAAADSEGLDQAARRKRTLTAEGRRTNMEAILASVRFHALEEFPHLLSNFSQTNVSAIYATNVNDRFLISKLFDALETGSLREAVGKIASHLESIPPIQNSANN
jgi:acetyl esterase/lipase